MGSSSSKITNQDRSILNLKLQRDKLKQYQKRIEIILIRETEIAIESLKNGNKTAALRALRQKKYQQSLLTQTDSQLETLEKLVSSIEFSLIEKDVMFGLKEANSVLTKLNKEMNLEKVEQLLEDSADAIAYQKQVDEMLSTKISVAEEEDIQAELEALQQDQVKLDLPSVPLTTLPTPVAAPEESQVEEVEETRQLIPAS